MFMFTSTLVQYKTGTYKRASALRVGSKPCLKILDHGESEG
jgi:hypothetical protein